MIRFDCVSVIGGTIANLAKLSRPRLYKPVPRSRLFEELDRLRDHSCIWVSGPPGAGKTTLVAAWVEARGLRNVWYQIDPADADPSTLFYYLRETAKAAAPRKRPPPLLTPEYLPDLPGFSRRFFRAYFPLLGVNAVLALDNCQEIQNSQFPVILAEAIAEVPPGVCVVAVSRVDPPPVLIRAQANGQLVTLGWEELRLTSEESREMALRSGISSPERIDQVHRSTSGWAAGVVLLAQYLKRRDPRGPLESLGTQGALFDYFTGELLHKATSDLRDLLLRTSLFPEVTPQMALEITGNADAPRLLQDVYHRQLLTDRRTDPELSYRYHDLFREFLRSRLEAELTAEDLATLKANAAALLAACGDAAHAIELFQQCGRYEVAADLVLERASTLLAQGRWQTLERWIAPMPEAFLASSPWLRYWLGHARMQANLREAGEILRRAFSAFAKSGNQLGQALSAAAILNAHYYEYNDFSLMDPWIAELDRLFDSGLTLPDLSTELSVRSALVLSMTFRQPRHHRLASHVVRAAELVEKDLDVNQRVNAAIGLITYYTFACDFVRGDWLVSVVTPLLQAQGLSALNQAYWWLVAGYYFEQPAHRHSNSGPYYDQADKVTEDHGLRQTQFLSRVFRGYTYACQGVQLPVAKKIIAEAAALLNPARVMDAAQLHLCTTMTAMALHESATAALHARLFFFIRS